VAGIHRLLHRVEELRSARVIVVIAGMEGALPSVVGGLVDKPIIAVPTSIRRHCGTPRYAHKLCPRSLRRQHR
jgi:NCAIR mutase (PurE)-related protein